MARRRRAALTFVGGTLLGFATVALVLWLGLRQARMAKVEAGVRAELGLPAEAFRLEAVEEEGIIRGSLRDVAIVGRGGDTIATAPSISLRFNAKSMAGNGPIEFSSVEVRRPTLRLVQSRKGDWNLMQAMRIQASGSEVQGEEGRPIVFRNVRIIDGRATVATPWTPTAGSENARFASLKQPRRVRSGSGWMQIRTLRGVDARIPLIRVGGPRGWRVEVSDLDAEVTNPDMRLVQLRGWAEEAPGERIRFAIETLRTPYSTFEADGTIRLADAGLQYDVDLRASPLDFRDLQGMGIPIPSTGTAAFALDVRTGSGGRTTWAVRDAQVAVLDSRASGRLTMVTAPGRDPVFTDTRISLDPLHISTLEELGYIERTAFAGQIRGTVASVDELRGGSGRLRVDLVTNLTPRGSPDAEPSVIAAEGLVALGGADPVRFEGLRVEARPLFLATLRPMFPEQADLLRGVVRGGATLTGTPQSVRIDGGDLAYEVGAAPASRITGISGTLTRGAQLSYSLRGRAEPLALATLTELFPALPFRTATLSGPIALSGAGNEVRFDVNLSGAAGGIDLQGTLALGEVPQFNVSGRVEAFRPGAVVTGNLPLEGPMTGTVAARGSAQNFRFDVNLAQGGGRLALGGNIRRPPGAAPQYDVAGRVDDFRLGLLLGQPGLLPGPVTGPIRISGGGRQAINFDVDLRGQFGGIDLAGWYAPGPVPRYALSGTVSGIDLRSLPQMGALPQTRLTAAVDIEGSGTTPETFRGRFNVRASPGSTIGGVPLNAGTVRLVAGDGVLRIQELVVALRGARLEATGGLGLTRAAPEPLRFTFTAPDLAAIAALVPGGSGLNPDLAGALSASGWVTGTVGAPSIRAALRGRNLRFRDWRAATLAADVQGSRGPGGWTGHGTVEGETVVLAGRETLQSIRLETNIRPGLASFGLVARRDNQTDLNTSGVLELRDGGLQGAILETLALRLGGTTWQLAERARIGWGAESGLAVENLMLRRTGAGTGWIEADGVLPPRGDADLRVRAGGIDVAELRRLFKTLPEMQGTVALDAAIRGPVTDPRLVVDLRVDSLRYGGVTTELVAINGTYANGRMETRADVRMQGRQILAAEGSIPMTLSLGGIVPAFEIRQDDRLTARIVADSLPLQLIASAVPALSGGAGTARAIIDVAGTPGDPRVSGTAGIDGGALTVDQLGVTYTEIGARLRLDGEMVRVDSLSARSGDGYASLRGTVRLDDPTQPQVYLTAVLDDFQVIDNEDIAKIEVDAQLALSGRLPSATVSGRIVIDQANIRIPNIGDRREVDIVDADVGELGADTIGVATVSRGAAMLGALNAENLTVVLEESVWLESEDARIQITGELDLDRTAGVTYIFGDLNAERGTYVLRVGPLLREFDIVEGRVRFYGTPDLNPALDIRAAHEVRALNQGAGSELTVFVDVTGTVQNPKVALSSNTRPPLPESELLSLLIFGRRSTELGGLPEELAQGVLVSEAIGGLFAAELEQQLVGTGLFDYVRLRARPTGFGGQGGGGFGGVLGATTLEVGWQLADDVFGSLEFFLPPLFSGQQQQTFTFGAAVDWQVSRSTTLRVANEPVRRDPLLLPFLRDQRTQRQFILDLTRRWEYGRPDVRAPMPTRPGGEEALPGELSTPQGTPPPPPPPRGGTTP